MVAGNAENRETTDGVPEDEEADTSVEHPPGGPDTTDEHDRPVDNPSG